MKFSAWYGIVVGFGMIAQWTFSIVRLGDQLDENVMWPLVLHNMVDQLQ